MKTYGQFCPVAQALEILAERWTLLVVRELLMGSTRFSELQRGVPLMSRTLLAQRLRTLQDAGIVQRCEGRSGPEYTLTAAGEALRPVVEGIGFWGQRFVNRSVAEHQLDPKLLMWDLRRRLRPEKLPDTRKVVCFRFSDARKGEQRFWLCASSDMIDLCLTNPGFEVELTVETDVRTLTEVWLGKRVFEDCVREGRIKLDGSPALKRSFPNWLALSVFADAS